MTRWTSDDVPSLVGRNALVTGATGGIGYETARVLARHGARVLVGARGPDRGATALARLRSEVPGAAVDLVPLDLADLESVARAAAEVGGKVGRLDLLVNNAGVMAVPERLTTKQGFELQFGTNHLGHFALTGLLLGPLLAADHARVVTVSSIAHRKGAIRLDDLNWEFEYSPSHAYGQSKLANVLFFTELDRRIRAKGLPVVSTGAHPGLTATNLGRSGPRLSASPRRAIRAVVVGTCTSVGLRIVGQSIEHGALPQLYAATAPDVVGGQYFGPDGPGEIRGGPTLRSISAAGANIEMARRLFERSEELTGVTYSELSSSK